MKRIFLFACVGLIALLGSQAHAAMNIRQNPDGTADWVGARPDDPFLSHCVGAVHLDTSVWLNGLSTQAVLSPVTNAVLRNIQVQVNQPGTAGMTQGSLQFYMGRVNGVLNTTHPLVYRSQNTNVATTINLIVYPQNRGRVFTISTPGEAGPFVSVPRLVSNTLMRNDPIFVQSAPGLGTAAGNHVTVSVLYTLCPR